MKASIEKLLPLLILLPVMVSYTNCGKLSTEGTELSSGKTSLASEAKPSPNNSSASNGGSSPSTPTPPAASNPPASSNPAPPANTTTPSTPSVPVGAISISSSAELLSALNSAKGGEVFALKDGNYSLNLTDKKYSSLVTIQGSSKVKFGSWNKLTNISNLMFNGVSFNHSSSATDNDCLVQPINSENLYFKNVNFVGSNGQGTGIYVKSYASAKNIVISGGSASYMLNGHMITNTEQILIENHEFHHLDSDGVQFSNVSDVIVRGNYFHDNQTRSGAHPDCVQFITHSENILIENNNCSGATQGFNSFGAKGYTVDNIIIRNNSLHLAYSNNVMLVDCYGEVSGNKLYTDKLASGNTPLIRISGGQVKVSGNTLDGKPMN